MTRAVSLANLADETVLTVKNDRVGIGSTQPTEKLNVVGVVSATSFFGDGSNLTGITAEATGAIGGLTVKNQSGSVVGTAGSVATLDFNGSNGVTVIASTGASGIATVLITGTNLSAASGAQRVVVTSLTSGAMTAAGTDADLAWNSTTNTLSATTFSGNITGTTGAFTGNVSIGGTLTYEDVTNIDSVGVVTARTGVKVLAGGISIVGGGATVAGIATFHDGADIEGFKIEDGQTAATPNGEFNFYLASGHFFRYTGTAGANYYPNFKHSASINLNDRMDVNDVVTATLAVNSATASYYIANTIHIDGNATGENSYTIDTDWVGGAAPSAGNGSGYDIYSFTIIKTADKNFTILANALSAA